MTYRNRGRDSTSDVARTVVYGSLAAWLVGSIIDWFDNRAAAKIRRQRLERASSKTSRPAGMPRDDASERPRR